MEKFKQRKKLFISLPMRGRSEVEIFARIGYLYESYFKDYELIDQYISEDIVTNNRLYFISNSIRMMGKADLVVFDVDWYNAAGCRVEYLICKLYDIPYEMLGNAISNNARDLAISNLNNHKNKYYGESDSELLDSLWNWIHEIYEALGGEPSLCSLYSFKDLLVKLLDDDINYISSMNSSKNKLKWSNEGINYIHPDSFTKYEPISVKLPVDADGIAWKGDETHWIDNEGIRHDMCGLTFYGLNKEWCIDSSLGKIPVSQTHHC